MDVKILQGMKESAHIYDASKLIINVLFFVGFLLISSSLKKEKKEARGKWSNTSNDYILRKTEA